MNKAKMKKKIKKRRVIPMKIKQEFYIETEIKDDETIEDAEARLYQELSDVLRKTSLTFSYGDSYAEIN